MAAGFVDQFRMAMGWWSATESATPPEPAVAGPFCSHDGRSYIRGGTDGRSYMRGGSEGYSYVRGGTDGTARCQN